MPIKEENQEIVVVKKKELEQATENGFKQLDEIISSGSEFIISNRVGTPPIEFKYLKYSHKQNRILFKINDKEVIGIRLILDFETDFQKDIIRGKYFYSSPFVKIIQNDEEFSYQRDITLENFHLVPDIDKLADKWFPKNEHRNLNDKNTDFTVTIPQNKDTEESFSYFLKEAWPYYKSGAWESYPPEPDKPRGSDPEKKWNLDWALWFIAIGLWRFLVLKTYRRQLYKPCVGLKEGSDYKEIVKDENLHLPPIEDYIPTRAINLNPDEVQKQIEGSGIKIRRAIIESACSTLNSGKNIIFAGPPGCGKSELAQKLSEFAGVNALSVTASPGWTTEELLGRYMPSNSQTLGILEYFPGYFIKAVQESKWLIIDEINRADIDSCFGELFSVLAGQPALLPYRVPATDNDGEESGEQETASAIPFKQIVILPAKTKRIPNVHQEQYDPYPNERYEKIQVSNTFRLIGTMNDFDASRLNQLSYAFMRRFNIIHVDAPVIDDMKAIIDDHINNVVTNLKNYQLTLYPMHGGSKKKDKEIIKKRAQVLFANENGEDLIQNNIIGVASALDVLNIGIEGINIKANQIPSPLKSEDYEGLVCSYLAMGVAMNVFPQLDAYATFQEKDKEKVEKSIQIIKEALTINDNKEKFDMVTIIYDDTDGYKIAKYPSADLKITINEYLKREMNRRFRQADSMNIDELFL